MLDLDISQIKKDSTSSDKSDDSLPGSATKENSADIFQKSA